MEFLTEMDGDEAKMDRLTHAEIKPEDVMQTDEWMYELREKELAKRRRFSNTEELIAEEACSALARCRITSDAEERNLSNKLLTRKKDRSKSSNTLSIAESTSISDISQQPAQPVLPFENRSTGALNSERETESTHTRTHTAPNSPASLGFADSPKYNILVRSESLAQHDSPKGLAAPSGESLTTLNRPPPKGVYVYLVMVVLLAPQITLSVLQMNLLGLIATAVAVVHLLFFCYKFMNLRTEAAIAEANAEMLYSLIPKDVVFHMHNGSPCIAVKHNSLTFSFTDLVGFTKMTAHLHYSKLVMGMNKLFILFDRLADKHEVRKVKTIGDCYMAVSGFRQQYTDHIKAMIDWCIDVIEELRGTRLPELMLADGVKIRCGLATGEAVSGVLGANKPIYDFWGDTVNMASRMESLSRTNRINCTEQVCSHLETKHGYIFEPMTDVYVKGKGMCNTFLLVTRHSNRLSEVPEKVAILKTDALTQLENIQSTEAFTKNLTYVITCVSELSSELELERAVELIVVAVRRLIHCDRATLFMVDEENEQLWSFNNVNSSGQKIRMPLNKGVAGWSAYKGESLMIPDAYEDPRFNKVVDVATGYKTKNLLCCPVKQNGRVLAVIQAINKLNGRFDERDTALLSLLGGQAGIHLMYGQQHERIDQLETRAQTLNLVSKELNSVVRVEEMFMTVATGARSFVRCSNAILYLMDESHTALYTRTPVGRQLVQLGDGIAGHVAVVGEAINIKNTEIAQTSFELSDTKTVKNVLCMPIKDNVTGKLMGVIEAQNRCLNEERTDIIAFTDDDEVALESYATFVAVAVKAMRAGK